MAKHSLWQILGKWGLDIIPVFVGILLAVYISNYKEGNNQKEYLRRSIEAIVSENKDNIKELEYAMQRQNKFRDTLRKYLNDDKYFLLDVIRQAQGLYTPDLKTVTWRFLISDSKHTLVPFKTISKLSEIDKYSGLVKGNSEKLQNLIFDTSVFHDPQLKKLVLLNISDFVSIEKKLLDELEKFNQHIQSDQRAI